MVPPQIHELLILQGCTWSDQAELRNNLGISDLSVGISLKIYPNRLSVLLDLWRLEASLLFVPIVHASA